MRSKTKRKNRLNVQKSLSSAAMFALERMEERRLLSVTLASWNFNPPDAIATNNTPIADAGSGTASSLGMNVYPTPNIGVTGDDVLLGKSSDTGANTVADLTQVWRVRAVAGASGAANGWSSQAPIGTQGAVFSTSTVGATGGINVTFDWYSTSAGEANLQLAYTLDDTAANPVWVDVPVTLGGSDAGLVNKVNSSSPNTVMGPYIQDSTGNSASAGQNWFTGLTGTITNASALNDPNFAIGMLNASTGADCINTGGTALNNTSGNWRFDNITITANGTSNAPPTIINNPASQKVAATEQVSFTASANGSPTPSVQWMVSTNGGTTFVNDTTDSGNTTDTLTITSPTIGQNNNQYEAKYTNSQGNATTTPATLTVVPLLITQQPASQQVAAGSTVNLVALTAGGPAPTVKWQVSTNGGGTFTDIPSATSPTYSFTAAEGLTGHEYRAIFTNDGGVTNFTTDAATLTVTGSPIAQWFFAGGQAPSPGGNSAPGTGNSPLPTASITSNNSTSVLGMNNDYTGVQSFPESDILPIRSSVNSNINEYLWRVRGGGGGGPTGSPGTPDGWSQNAPVDTQGVQFDINTTGYSNITLNFNWTQGAVGDMQAQYSADGGNTWSNVGIPIQATGNDYYGVTASTATTALYSLTANTALTINVASSSGFYDAQNITVGGISAIVTGFGTGTLTILPTASGSAASGSIITGVPNPTGVTVNLQGITAANNNPNFELRLVGAYDPGLPTISDGNLLDPATHGQFASGFGSASSIQVIQINDHNSFTLTLGALTTGAIAYSSDPVAMTSNIQTALNTLLGAGTTTVAPTGNGLGTSISTAYEGYAITFTGSDANVQEPTMTVAGSTNAVAPWEDGTPSGISANTTDPFTLTQNQSTVLSVDSTTGFVAGNPITVGNISCLVTSVGANTLTVTPESSGAVLAGTKVKELGVTRFVDGSGSWEFGNISFNGDVTSGAPGILNDPASETAAGGLGASFTATAYSESTPTVQWQVSTNGGGVWSNVSGGTVTPPIFSPAGNGQYTSTYSFNTDVNLDQSGFEYRAVFTNGSGTTNSNGATLTVVAATAPFVTTQPNNASVQEGNVAIFTAAAAANPSPTVQWQISSDGGTTWTNLVDGVSVNGSQTDTLEFTTTSDTTESGDKFRAVFTNVVTSTNSNAANLNVFPTETVLTDWDFAAAAQVSINNPAPVPQGTDNSLDVGGTASGVGMNLPFNANDPATGTDGNGSSEADDVTNTPGALNVNFNENTWRIRGGVDALTGGTPANGWSNFAAEYTQGVQFLAPTTGFSNVYVTMDWYSTTSGELDAQPQYTLDGGSTWNNLGPQVQAVSNDFYGATANGGPVPLMFDVSGISGASNNPNFGIRLVNAYNMTLSNAQTVSLGDSHNFTLTFNSHTTGTIVNSPTGTTTAANIQTAISALSNVGAHNVTVTYDSTNGVYDVEFVGALGTAVQQTMTITDLGASQLDGVTHTYASEQPSGLGVYANAALVGTPAGPAPYNGSKGNWRFDNIVFHGALTVNSNNEYVREDNSSNLDIWNSTTNTGTPAVSYPATYIGGLTFNGPAGGDSLTLDLSNGDPLAGQTLSFKGGAGTNTIKIIGSTGADSVSVGASSISDTTPSGSDTVSYTGANAIVFNGNGGADTLTQTAQPGGGASLTLQNPNSQDTLAVNGGTFSIPASAPLGGSLAFNLGTLSVGTGATVAMALSDIPADATVLTVNTLNDLGTIDITNNTLDINYGVNISPVAAIGTLVKTGYNNAAFNGTGITSSKVKSVNAAHSNAHLFAVAYADSADSAVASDHFATNTVVVKAALAGDTNMDGKVNFTDFLLLSSNFNKPNTSWDQGNFNFGSTTNFGDFLFLSANFNSSAPLDNGIAQLPTSEPADAQPASTASVPASSSASAPLVAAVTITGTTPGTSGFSFSNKPITASVLAD